MPPKLVAAAPGYTRLKLEEPYRPTAPFLVKSFLRHAERVKYVPKLGDGDLLRSAGELSFELEKQPVLRSNNLHQLYSVRHSALPESKQGKRDWNGHRRNYRVAVPVQHPASKVDRAEAKETVPPERCVMLRVALYHGTKKAREFEVHQHQTLYELRRVLTCPTAAEIAYQRAELARRGGEELLEHFPAPSDGAAFCIEDAWFVSGGDDPSESVRSYVNAEGGQHWGEPRRMDETTIGDLTLRLGQQYLYVHHGDCEHSIVFTRCYLLNELDTLHRPPRSWGGYPRLVFERFVPTPYCTTCEREPAVWEVVGDKLADRSPCRLCEVCHYQFHYDKDGHLIKANGDYFIYPILKEVHDALEGEQPMLAAPYEANRAHAEGVNADNDGSAGAGSRTGAGGSGAGPSSDAGPLAIAYPEGVDSDDPEGGGMRMLGGPIIFPTMMPPDDDPGDEAQELD